MKLKMLNSKHIKNLMSQKNNSNTLAKIFIKMMSKN